MQNFPLFGEDMKNLKKNGLIAVLCLAIAVVGVASFYGHGATTESILTADGGAPPPPPPWGR